MHADIVHPSWEVGKPVTPAFARYKDAYEHSVKLLGYVADDIVSIGTLLYVSQLRLLTLL